MALETATYVGSLVSTNPTSADPKSQGDDHLRMIKGALLASFAGFLGTILVTGTEAQGATANDYTVTIAPAPAAYTSGIVLFVAAHANTGAATVQINALGTKSLLDVDGGALISGDIESGSVVLAYYDGAAFRLLSGNDRADRGGETYSGTHNFTGATVALPATATGVTATLGDSSTLLATTAFVAAQAFSAALPGQSGNANLFVTTNGISARWDSPRLIDPAAWVLRG